MSSPEVFPKVVAEKSDEAVALRLGIEQMQKMSPFDDEREVELPSALLCHVMLLNSVLERQGNRIAEEHGLTLSQWMALGCIGHGGEAGVRHSELGQRLMLSKAPITGVIDRLERAGYVKRGLDPHDRRAARVVITAEGCAMWETVRADLEPSSHEICACFSEAEQHLVLSLLSRMLASTASIDPILNFSQHCPGAAAFETPTKTRKGHSSS